MALIEVRGISRPTICITLILVLALVVLLKLRRERLLSVSFHVPGGVTAILICLSGAVLMAVWAALSLILQQACCTRGTR
jgi:hypothetical protein